jgi:long-chain fatty acid transport protein
MGGTAIGVAHGAESGLSNPALITKIKSSNEISFGGTLFMPDVENENDLSGLGMGATSSSVSEADMSVIPEVSIASRITDNFYTGIGIWGTAGMGVDYRDADATTDTQLEMVTNLQLMQFGVPLAFTANGFSAAVTPILQYGSLDIEYSYGQDDGNPATGPGNVGMGVAQDLKFGYNLGVSYEVSNFTVGAIYKSQIDMEYKGFGDTVAPFTGGLGYTNDKLSTPKEYGIGVSYKINEHTIALDYKKIKWSSAEGYKDFEWDDQTVYAIGYEYARSNWAVRLGYNHASSPIEEQSYTGANNANLSAGVVNTFNLLGFPGIVETHYTIGGTYAFNEKFSVDLAYVYAKSNTQTYENFARGFGAPTAAEISTKHSQDSFSVGLNYNF